MVRILETFNLFTFLSIFLAMVVVIVPHMFRRRKNLPPMCELTFYEFSRIAINGKLHRYFNEAIVELGLVFRIPTIGMHHAFIICDPSLARLILEGDTSQQIPAAEKDDRAKTIDKTTANTPSILTKRTHGEG
jgi:hypothetical protein